MILALCLTILALVYLLARLLNPPPREVDSGPKPIRIWNGRRK
jgi:hypothetical protein